MLNVKSILYKKWQSNSLGNFYILNAPLKALNKRSILLDFIKSFFIKIIQEHKNINNFDATKILEIHSDFLLINCQEEEITSDENISIALHTSLDIFFNFLKFKNVEFMPRFIVWADAHKITKNISNKMLKSLEEPLNTCIFFLNPSEKKLLSTIESRAINLRIDNAKQADSNFKHLKCIEPTDNWQILQQHLSSFVQEANIDLGDQFIAKLFDFLKNKENEASLLSTIKESDSFFIENCFLTILLELGRCRHGTFLGKENLLKTLRWFDVSQTFQNSTTERFYQLLYALKDS